MLAHSSLLILTSVIVPLAIFVPVTEASCKDVPSIESGAIDEEVIALGDKHPAVTDPGMILDVPTLLLASWADVTAPLAI